MMTKALWAFGLIVFVATVVCVSSWSMDSVDIKYVGVPVNVKHVSIPTNIMGVY